MDRYKLPKVSVTTGSCTFTASLYRLNSLKVKCQFVKAEVECSRESAHQKLRTNLSIYKKTSGEMSFFIRSKNKTKDVTSANKQGKRKGIKGAGADKSKKRRLVGSEDEEILSDSDAEVPKKDVEYSSSEEDEETEQEKRLRLAKQYIEDLKNKEADQEDDDQFFTDPIAHRLKKDVLEQTGRLHKDVAAKIVEPNASDIRTFRGHQLPPTCLVISTDDKYVFSASKDCSIIKFELETGKKVQVVHGGRKGTDSKHKGHTAQVLCLAISTDGNFLVSGDRNKLIHVWNPDSMELLHTLQGHRDAVSALSFRKGTHQLFSASLDRTVKIWNLDEMAYVETLFGHQDVITGIDSLSRDRAVTSGGRDNSLRVWKVVEESQLVFHGHGGSVDCVALINEENMISGTDDNSLSLWGVMKKKPLTSVKEAHPGGDGKENWITAVTALQNTDLVASGSKDGCIRLWQCGKGFKTLTHLHSIPMNGFVNALKFSNDGKYLLAAVGQEHRLGRWWRIKEAKNSICVIKLNRKLK